MKKTNFILALLAFVMSFAAVSCKKDPTVKELLQDKKWQLTAETTGGKDSMGTYPACSLDNTETYKSSGVLSRDEGTTKCDPADPQTDDSASWVLSADEKIVTVKIPFGTATFSIDFTIVEISASKLVVSYKDPTSSAGDIIGTYTAK